MLKIKQFENKPFYNPTKSYVGDAGWDVKSTEDITLHPHESYQFKLGFSIVGEPGKVYVTHGRSSLAIHFGIDIIGDIIDNGYTGEVSIILKNGSKDYIHIKDGDKIGQILVQNVDDDSILEVNGQKVFLTVEDRQSKAHGSTGK